MAKISKAEEHAIAEINELMKKNNIDVPKIAEVTGRDPNPLYGIFRNPIKSKNKLQLSDYIAIADLFDVSLDELFGRSSHGGMSACMTIKDVCKALMAIYQSPYRFSLDSSHVEKEGVGYYFPLSLERDGDGFKYSYGTFEGKRYEAAITINNFLEEMNLYARQYHREAIDEDEYDRKMKNLINSVTDDILYEPSQAELRDLCRAERHKKKINRSKQL